MLPAGFPDEYVQDIQEQLIAAVNSGNGRLCGVQIGFKVFWFITLPPYSKLIVGRSDPGSNPFWQHWLSSPTRTWARTRICK